MLTEKNNTLQLMEMLTSFLVSCQDLQQIIIIQLDKELKSDLAFLLHTGQGPSLCHTLLVLDQDFGHP